MTKHELLDYFFYYGPATIRDVHDFDLTVSYVAAWKQVKKLHREGLLKKAGRRGKAVVYELSERGERRRDYLNLHGCKNPRCSCHEDK